MFACKTMKTFWLPSYGRRPPQGVHSSPRSFSAPEISFIYFPEMYNLSTQNLCFATREASIYQNGHLPLTPPLHLCMKVSDTWKLFQSTVEAPWGSWDHPLRFLESPSAHSQCPCSCPLPQSPASFSAKENYFFFQNPSFFNLFVCPHC